MASTSSSSSSAQKPPDDPLQAFSTSTRGSDNNNGYSLDSWKSWWEELSDQQRLDRLRSCTELDQILKSCQDRQRQKQRQKRQQQEETKSKNVTNGGWFGRRSRPKPTHENGNTIQPTNNIDALSQPLDLLERTSQGVRSMKYFGWRGILTKKGQNDTDSDNDTKLVAIQDTIRSSCSREQHAVWACRAVATGCGQDLATLKRCFDDGGGNDDSGRNGRNNNDYQTGSNQKPVECFNKYDILMSPHTSYHLGGGGGGGGGVKSTGPKQKKKVWKDIVPCHDQQVLLGRCVTNEAHALLERKRERNTQT